ncbi:MAG: hypothetical protein HC913_16515 [Microscillaceae bacterium]|nr:hypothetical protein [Microscillaceae bacterium]
MEKGYLTIGFSDFTTKEMVDKVLANDWNYFNAQFQKMWGRVPRTRLNLWNFLKFEKGDIIIVPSWGIFFVCEITDERPMLIGETYSEGLKSWGNKNVSTNGTYLLNENSKEYDLGFARKVNVIYKNVSKEKFADAALTSRMKIRQTNAQINDLKNSVEKSIENYKANKPIHLHSIVIEKNRLYCIRIN